MNTHVAQRNSITISLQNLNQFEDSEIKLFSLPSYNGSTPQTSSYYSVTQTLSDALFAVTPSQWEIFQVSTSTWVSMLPSSGTPYTRDQLLTALETTTGEDWEYEQISASTIYFSKTSTQLSFSKLRFQGSDFSIYNISTTPTAPNTTIQVSSSGPVTYDQLCLYLNQAPEGYLFTTCYLQANTIEQINQPITLKNIQANNVEEIIPKDVTINPDDKQLIIPNIELNHVVNNNQISYTLLAGQSCRFIFNYVKNNASVLNKPTIDILPSQLQTPEPQKTTDKEKINSAFRLFGLE